MFNRVRLRLTLLTVSIVLALYVISSAAVYAIVRQVVVRQLDTTAIIVLHQLEHRNPVDVMSSLPRDVYLVLEDPPMMLSNTPSALTKRIQSMITSRPGYSRWSTLSTDGQGTSYRILYFPLASNATVQANGPQRFVLIAVNASREMDVLTRLGNVLLAVGTVGLIAATLAGFFLAERVMRPIQRAWQRQVEFVADASHELRTPLAVIQSNLGIVLEHTNQSVIDNLEWINNAHSESRRLSKLVADLLTLARSDANSTPLSLQPIGMHALLGHIVELFEPIADAKQLTLGYESSQEVVVSGDKDRLHQLFVILMDNACKYTPIGGSVSIVMEKAKGLAVIRVMDTGTGISGEELAHIFERFYRSDKARAHDADTGTGLGLAIAKWIVEAHHGKIAASSELGKGTTVQVQLPTTAEEPKPLTDLE